MITKRMGAPTKFKINGKMSTVYLTSKKYMLNTGFIFMYSKNLLKNWFYKNARKDLVGL